MMGLRLFSAFVLILLAATLQPAEATVSLVSPDDDAERILGDEKHRWYKKSLQNILATQAVAVVEEKQERAAQPYYQTVLDAYRGARAKQEATQYKSNNDHYKKSNYGYHLGKGYPYSSKQPSASNTNYYSKGSHYGNSGKGKGKSGSSSKKKGKSGKGSSKSKRSKSKASNEKKSKDSGDSGKDHGPGGLIQTRVVPNVSLTFILGRRRLQAKGPQDRFTPLREATIEWFEQHIRAQLPRSVALLNTVFEIDLIGEIAGRVEIRFSFIRYAFAGHITDVPSASEINNIMQESITPEFILEVVREVPGFETVTEVLYESLDNTFNPDSSPPSSPSPSPSPFPSPSPSPINTPPPSGLPPFFPPGPLPGDADMVRIQGVYLAYSSDQDPLIEPVVDQYQEQIDVTVDYFERIIFQQLLGSGFEDSFLGVEAVLLDAALNAGFPSAEFNILMEYKYFDIYFVPGTVDAISQAASEALVPDVIFQLLLESISPYFLQSFVRTVESSAFETANQVFMGLYTDPTTPTSSPSNGSESPASTPTQAPSLDLSTTPTPTQAPSLGLSATQAPVLPMFVPTDPIPDDADVIRIPGALLALVSNQGNPITEIPAAEPFEKLLDDTISYWENSVFFVLQTIVNADGNNFASDFLGIDALRAFRLNAGVPEDRFNILIEYDYIDLFFAQGTIALLPVVEGQLFDSEAAYQILKNSITADYIFDVVRVIDDVLWQSVSEVIINKT